MNEQQPTSPPAEKPQDNRDERGRFAAGNRGGPGNPFARQTAALRRALVNAVTETDITDIAAALLDRARQGDVAACKLVFSYTLGKPAPAADPDTLDQQELKNLAANHVGLEELLRVINAFPIEMVLTMIHAMLPHLDAAKAQRLGDQLAAQDEEEAKDGDDAEAAQVQSSPTEPQPLDETVRAWQEEVEELKGRLNPTSERTPAPARPTAAGERGTPQEPLQPVPAGGSARPPWQAAVTDRQETVLTESRAAPATMAWPITNGSDGESPGYGDDRRADNKRL
jgi:hypothetical protein